MYRLIIIDDDAGTSNNLGNYFPWEEHGFQVVEKFYDGFSACQFLKNNPVDLIISDIKCRLWMESLWQNGFMNKKDGKNHFYQWL